MHHDDAVGSGAPSATDVAGRPYGFAEDGGTPSSPRRRFFELDVSSHSKGYMPPSEAVSFAQISRILELTDRLGLNREWVEIPLSPERPGLVRRLANGKLEIVVDADEPFENWLASLEGRILQVQRS